MLINIFLVWTLLIFLHEIGHIASAKVLKLKVIGYGIKLRPIPHFCYSQLVKEFYKTVNFLLSGF